jgi:hypothetical protein
MLLSLRYEQAILQIYAYIIYSASDDHHYGIGEFSA